MCGTFHRVRSSSSSCPPPILVKGGASLVVRKRHPQPLFARKLLHGSFKSAAAMALNQDHFYLCVVGITSPLVARDFASFSIIYPLPTPYRARVNNFHPNERDRDEQGARSFGGLRRRCRRRVDRVKTKTVYKRSTTEKYEKYDETTPRDMI